MFLVEFMEGEGDLLIFLFFLFIEEFVDDMLLFVLLFEFWCGWRFMLIFLLVMLVDRKKLCFWFGIGIGSEGI